MAIAQPQNPPFAFPDRVRLIRAKVCLGEAVADEGGDAVKDDKGDVILMGYSGPTPSGRTSQSLWIVAHDAPTRVHPAEKYPHQRYRRVPTDG